ncbi:hypothetical protein [Streptomyces yangpuensis]|uniref:hypothetical protein n=1 Tax=Streptomyces yangpuensis TaxID=1648182 RepID=UPI0036487398
MPELFAVCTPNSLPHPDGRVEHGYQINVMDQALEVVATVELPDWTRCDLEEAGRHLTGAGFEVAPEAEGGWKAAGLGFLVPVTRTALAR